MRNLGLSISASAFLLATVAVPTTWSDLVASPTLPATLSHSRPSLATMFDSTGKLTYQANNGLVYSTDFTNAAWSKSLCTIASGVADPFGGTNACTYTATGNGTISQNSPITSLNGSRKFIVSIWAKLNGPALTGIARLYNAANGSPVTLSLTSSWQQFYIVSNGAANDGAYFYFGLSAAGDKVDIYGACLSAVTYETSPRSQDQVVTTSAAYYGGSRFDYDPLTLSCRGLLIEGPITNLALSSHMQSGWTGIGCTKSTDGTLDPSGALASKVTASAGASTHNWTSATQNTSLTVGVQYTYSVYVKAGTYSKILVNSGNNLTHYTAATFDISGTSDISASQVASNGDTGSSGRGVYIGNGWFRLCITFTTIATETRYVEVAIIDNLTGNTFTGFGEKSWTAAGTETFYTAMAQVEAGAFASSWFPSGTAALSRAGDAVQFVGAALTVLQGSTWSAFVEFTALGVLPGTARLINLQSAGDAPLYASSDTTVSAYSGAGTTTATVGGSGKFSTTARAGISYNGTSRSIAANGGAVVTESKAFAAVASAQLGSTSGSSNFAPGWYRSFAIFNTAVAPGAVQSKSVVGSSYLT